MTRYVVFWIPITAKKEVKCLTSSLAEFSLKDIPDSNGVKIKAEIDTSNKNITFRYKDDSESAFHELSMECCNLWPSGFVQYSYEIDDNPTDHLSDSLKKSFHQAYYHYLKGFFHKHIQHHGEEDSLLKPIFSEARLDWGNNTDRLRILRSLFQDYQQKFKGSADEINLNVEEVVSEISANKDITKNIRFLHSYIVHNYRIKGEILYARFLLSLTKGGEMASERKALEDAIVLFEEADRNLRFWYDHYLSITSFLSGNKSVHVGWLGCFFGIASICFTAFVECQHKNDLPNSELKVFVDSLAKSHGDALNVIDNNIAVRDTILTNLGSRIDGVGDNVESVLKRVNNCYPQN